ncbi:MAG: hypothetical protein HZB31_11305 [Nitrospirae bacterium]|nr:hypothetical protein [Nitrospirota bacterium]
MDDNTRKNPDPNSSTTQFSFPNGFHFETPYNRIIGNGLAMVKVIEGLLILKDYSGSWRETLLINLTLSLYQHRLREMIKTLPAEIGDEILLAGRKEELGL